VLEADIESFFDRVVHRKLRGMLREQIVDPRVIGLISGFLNAGAMEIGKPWQETREGTPQGGPLSPLLANIYLHYGLDRRFTEVVSSGGHTQLFRYADDFIIVTDHPGRMKSVRRALSAWMAEVGLRLKESKTREIDMSSHKRSRDSHLDFLGYRFHLRAFKDNRKRFWIARQPSEKSRVAFRANLKEKLRPTLTILEARRAIEAIWRGWGGYFRYGNANRVLYRERQSINRAVIMYLRRKFRCQRRPVPWRRLFKLAKGLWSNLPPPKCIPKPMRQSEDLWAFA
jgi:hypothetical protein